jgi:predicted RNA binding protein YcfA (HicA-like mRNA interferase family)
MKPREVIQRLLADGWIERARKGTSHRQFTHAAKVGKITVPDHNRDLPPGTLHIILKKAGLK